MKHYRKCPERGVEMVEVALILPVLMLICFGVVDLLRISYCESLLQRVATDIAVKARTAPNLDYDLRDFNSSSGEFSDFTVARAKAINDGLQSAKQSFSDPGVQSDAQLIATSQLDNSLNNYAGTPPAPVISSAVILRPGEEATFNYIDDYGTPVTDVVRHPIIPADASGKVPPQRMDALLDLAPIHVEVRAEVQPILWAILGTRIVRGTATTYREKGIRRMIMVDNAGVDLAGPTATRKTGTGENWLVSPEPIQPLASIYNWSWAFTYTATRVDYTYCAKIFPSPPTPCGPF